MNRTFLMAALAAVLSMASVATATPCNTATWTFGGIDAQCGSGNSGVTFTQAGKSITIFPELLINGVVQSNPSPVNGLFEVNKSDGHNLANGIGPFDSTQGGSSSFYTGQGGIQDSTVFNWHTWQFDNIDELLYIEIDQSSIPSGTILNFLMQEGDVADTFNVYTGTFASGATPPNLSQMNEILSNVAVGHLNGSATVPQFSITTTTTGAKPIEFIAIEADCNYLLLNQITTPVAPTPEPRFYGLLVTGLFGIAAIYARKRRVAAQSA